MLPTMGGQTALNTALALFKDGTLEKYGVKMIGADAEAIEKAEDRLKFREAMDRIGLESPRSAIAHSVDEALAALDAVGLPAIIRPSFTLGGTGGGIAYNREEFVEIVARRARRHPTTEVLIEESVLGWKEYEMEVVRDRSDNAIIICSIENVDPMGVHTGEFDHRRAGADADRQGISDHAQREHRLPARNRRRNRRFERPVRGQSEGRPAGRDRDEPARRRAPRRWPRRRPASRSPRSRPSWRSATRSTRSRTTSPASTPASFEPTIDYVVTKIPRFAFEKFKGAEAMLSTAMKSVGEVMAIGRNFHESLQKALRGLETGLIGLDGVARSTARRGTRSRRRWRVPTPDRLLVAAQALREGLHRRRGPRDHPIRSLVPRADRGDRRAEEDDLPRRPAGRRRGPAAAEGDGLLRQAAGRAEPQVGPYRAAAGSRRGRARHGLIHDAVKAMTGATTEDEVRRAAPQARRAAGVQADRHLRRRVRGEDALHVLDLRGAELRRARGREPAHATAARSSSSAAGRTGSGRGSSSTIAASTPPSRWRRPASRRS